jgi:hypothetical protein
MGGAAAVMVVADRALAMEVPAYRHPSTVMAALVGGHHGSRHDDARRDPLPLPRWPISWCSRRGSLPLWSGGARPMASSPVGE